MNAGFKSEMVHTLASAETTGNSIEVVRFFGRSSSNDPLANDRASNEPIANDEASNDPRTNDRASNGQTANDEASNDPRTNDQAAQRSQSRRKLDQSQDAQERHCRAASQGAGLEKVGGALEGLDTRRNSECPPVSRGSDHAEEDMRLSRKKRPYECD